LAKLIMAYWDCPVCGSKGIAGNVMNCPTCGRARGDVQFYMKEGEAAREEDERQDLEYLSDEQAQEMGDQPDWYCSFCNSLNKNGAEVCANCGASRKDSESNYFDQLRKKQEAERAEQAAQPHATVKTKKSYKGLIIFLLILAAMFLLFRYMSGSDTEKGLEVTGVAWERSIPIEENIEYNETGWSLPSGATLKNSYQAIQYYDTVLDHYEEVEVQRSREVLDHYETYYTYEDNGNGTYSEVEHERPVYETEYYTETVSQPVYVSVPRYGTKYEYSVWRWTTTRKVTASGTDHEPVWPELDLKENEREGSPRQENYLFMTVNEKGATSKWVTAAETWDQIQVGNRLSITTPRAGGAAYITDDNGNAVAAVYRTY